MIIHLNLNYYSGAELIPYNLQGRGLGEGRKSVIFANRERVKHCNTLLHCDGL